MKTLEDLLKEAKEKIAIFNQLSEKKKKKRKYWDDYCRCIRRVERIEALLKKAANDEIKESNG